MEELSKKLNQDISSTNKEVYEMLSEIGKKLFFPKGILKQSFEAKKKAKKINATIGVATENKKLMYLPSITTNFSKINLKDSIAYAPSSGIDSLRKIWKNNLYDKNPSIKGKISLPIITSGITHALSTVADIWINQNDSIILPKISWGNYNMIFSIKKKANLEFYNMFTPNRTFNLNEFEKKIKNKSKKTDKIIVLFNFPHNPSGYSITQNEAYEIKNILTKFANIGNKIIALCDDAYFGLFYENNVFKESLFSILYNSHKRLLAIKVDGATKENFSWGLRIGFITYGNLTNNQNILYNALEMKTSGCIRGTISSTSHLSQTILKKSLETKNFNKEKTKNFLKLKNRFKILKKCLEKKKYEEVWSTYPFNSGYFMCLKLKTVNAEELRMHLLKKYNVGVISIQSENIRIAFSCVDSKKIKILLEIIFLGIKDLENR